MLHVESVGSAFRELLAALAALLVLRESTAQLRRPGAAAAKNPSVSEPDPRRPG